MVVVVNVWWFVVVLDGLWWLVVVVQTWEQVVATTTSNFLKNSASLVAEWTGSAVTWCMVQW